LLWDLSSNCPGFFRQQIAPLARENPRDSQEAMAGTSPAIAKHLSAGLA
jgi:hypothetical protein